MTLRFTVIGHAQTMGSKRAFQPKGWTHPVITDTNRNLKSWQAMVSHAAADAVLQLEEGQRVLMTGPVSVSVLFFLPKPKSKPKKTIPHVVAPDLDKLIRAVADALSAVVYRDDSQITEWHARKAYCADYQIPHADVTVEGETMTPEPKAPPAPDDIPDRRAPRPQPDDDDTQESPAPREEPPTPTPTPPRMVL